MDLKNLTDAVGKVAERFAPAVQQATEAARALPHTSGGQMVQSAASSVQGFADRNPVSAEVMRIQGRLAAKTLAAKVNPRAAALWNTVDTAKALGSVAAELAGGRKAGQIR